MVVGGPNDPDRNYYQHEQERLTRNLFALTQRVWQIDRDIEYSVELICSWHAELFVDVRGHAGVYRSKDFGEHYLTFGPNRSPERADVPRLLTEHVITAKKIFDQLHALEHTRNPLDFVRDVIEGSLYIHADFIRIHPFRDGNGRISRLILNYHLLKYNLLALSIASPKQEYIACLNKFFETRDMEPLLHLGLRLFADRFR